MNGPNNKIKTSLFHHNRFRNHQDATFEPGVFQTSTKYGPRYQNLHKTYIYKEEYIKPQI